MQNGRSFNWFGVSILNRLGNGIHWHSMGDDEKITEYKKAFLDLIRANHRIQPERSDKRGNGG